MIRGKAEKKDHQDPVDDGECASVPDLPAARLPAENTEYAAVAEQQEQCRQQVGDLHQAESS